MTIVTGAFRCPVCGNYRDTPMHELGCPAGAGVDQVGSLRELADDLVRTCEAAWAALVQRRVVLGLSVETVADRMGCSPSTVRALEHGRRSPRLLVLRRYALAVHARLDIRVVPVEVEAVQ